MPMEPTVTMSLEALDTYRSEHKRMSEELLAAQQRADKAELRAGGGEIAEQLLAIIRNAVPVMQFGVGNLDPETIRRWPFQNLRIFSNTLLQIPGVTDGEKELCHDWLRFADQAEAVEIARARGTHHAIAGVPRSALGSAGAYVAQVRAVTDTIGDAAMPVAGIGLDALVVR